MSRRPRQSDPASQPPRYPSSLHHPQKRHPNPPATQYHQLEPASDGFPRASSSKRPLLTSTRSLNSSFLDRRPPKSPKSLAAVTSPGWDPIGDDDEIYIQSDDTHLRELAAGTHRSSTHTRNARLDQSLTHLRKRKRSPQPSSQDQTLRSSRPGSTSNSLRAPLKYDDEGCSNCRTKQSTCWWKKSKSIVLSDGTEAWGEEKLCNPCSIHWNKNGFHRHVRPKAPKETARPRIGDVPSRFSSSRPRRSCSTTFAPGPSSPTASKTRVHSTLLRRTRHSRSPSQLTTLAPEREEREARIVQRSLAKACAKSEALRQKQRFMKTGYISEEDAPFDDPIVSPPPAPLRPPKHSRRKSSCSINQATHLPPEELPSPESYLFNAFLDHASPGLDQHPNSTNRTKQQQYLVDPTLTSYPTDPVSNILYLSADPHMANISVSPLRTPPPNSRTSASNRVPRVENSPGSLMDFDNILSPSFLNASPNSLLRRLNSQKPIAGDSGGARHLSATSLPNFLSGVSEKVFSPNRNLNSNSPTNPTPPMAEPIKRAEVPSNSRLIGSAGLLDAHMNSESSNRSKKSIFSPPRPTPKSRDSGSRKSRPKSMAISSEKNGRIFESSNARRSKKDNLDEFLNGTKILLDRSMSHAELGCPDKRVSDSSRKQSHAQSSVRSLAPTNQHMARTIWSRRFESTGISSDDSHLEEMHTTKFGYRPRSESHHSETNLTSAPIERVLAPTGLSSAVSKALNPAFSADWRGSNRFGSGLGFSDGNVVSASSPPVLPPPSDCSEGITPHSGEPQSDDGEKEPKKPSMSKTATEFNAFTNFLGQPRTLNGIHNDHDLTVERHDRYRPLSDITTSLNCRSRQTPDHSRLSATNQNPSQSNNINNGLSPELMSALSEAIKAGLSADELAQALRNLDSSGPNNTTVNDDDTNSVDPRNCDNNNNNLINPMIANNSVLEPLSEVDHVFQSSYDPNQFFLPPDPIPHPVHSNNYDQNNYLDAPHLHHHYTNNDASLFSDDLNIDPNLMGDIEAILNQHRH